MRKIAFSPPDITQAEISAVSDVLRSGWITTGPRTKAFEKSIATYCGTNTAVCLNSATAGLELVLRLFSIGEGDEVITSAYTYSASASVIAHVGAKIVLVDTAKDSYEMDYCQLEKAITAKTKAIIPVDIAGVLCDYKKIFEIVNKRSIIFCPNSNMQQTLGRVLVLSDAAHSFGAIKERMTAGNIADFTCFSFHAVKNLTTGEGGAITWKANAVFDNDLIYRQFMLMSLHGQSKDALAKTGYGNWEYDILAPLYKCNMTDVASAIGLVQLERYGNLLKRRQEIVNKYDSAFSNGDIVAIKHIGKDYVSSMHLYLTRVKGANESRRNNIIIEMAKHNVSLNVHYKPLPLLTAYKNLGFNIKDFPNAFAQYQSEITLPLHTLLTDGDVDYVIEKYIEAVANV
jgi:dTDP-4-amino-4,6-dideoxygalactose transaminase